MDENSSSDISSGGGTGASVTPHEQGAALMKMGRFAEAAAALRRAVETDPNDEASWRLLGGALASKGDPAGAMEAFRHAVELVPDSAKNHYNLALAYQGAGDLYQAKTHLERALALEPGYEQARLRLDELAGQADLMGSGSAAGMAAQQPSTAAAAAAPPAESAFERTMVMDAMSPATETASPGLSTVGGGGGSSYQTPPVAGSSGSDIPSLRPVAGVGAGGPPPAEPTIMGTGGGGGTGAYAPTPMMGMAYGQANNTSGMKGEVPAELQGGWNWGAFWFSWLWLMNHGLVAWGVGLLVLSFIPYISILSLGAAIYLGVSGNKLGWQNRRFDSIDDFRACQRKWAMWILYLLIPMVLIWVLILIPLIMNGVRR